MIIYISSIEDKGRNEIDGEENRQTARVHCFLLHQIKASEYNQKVIYKDTNYLDAEKLREGGGGWDGYIVLYLFRLWKNNSASNSHKQWKLRKCYYVP